MKRRVLTALDLAAYLKKELIDRNFKLKGKSEINVFATEVPERYKIKRELLFKKGWRIGNYGDLWRFIVMPTSKKEHIIALLNELDK